jgi:hypothetical protein
LGKNPQNGNHGKLSKVCSKPDKNGLFRARNHVLGGKIMGAPTTRYIVIHGEGYELPPNLLRAIYNARNGYGSWAVRFRQTRCKVHRVFYDQSEGGTRAAYCAALACLERWRQVARPFELWSFSHEREHARKRFPVGFCGVTITRNAKWSGHGAVVVSWASGQSSALPLERPLNDLDLRRTLERGAALRLEAISHAPDRSGLRVPDYTPWELSALARGRWRSEIAARLRVPPLSEVRAWLDFDEAPQAHPRPSARGEPWRRWAARRGLGVGGAGPGPWGV